MSDQDHASEKVRLEHISLNQSSSKKIDRWLEQVEAKRVRLSRKEFVNWLIEKSSDNLSSADLNSIVERFYDE